MIRNVKIVIMSHLSDAQELVNTGLGDTKTVNDHINFAKVLLLNYFNTDASVEEKELNELWQQVTSK